MKEIKYQQISDEIILHKAKNLINIKIKIKNFIYNVCYKCNNNIRMSYIMCVERSTVIYNQCMYIVMKVNY